jgi:hypothetical protein
MYHGGTHHYVVEVHLNAKGFKEVRDLLGETFDVERRPVTDSFDMYSIDVCSVLKLFKLEPKNQLELW